MSGEMDRISIKHSMAIGITSFAMTALVMVGSLQGLAVIG
jgi:hypothetical protein